MASQTHISEQLIHGSVYDHKYHREEEDDDLSETSPVEDEYYGDDDDGTGLCMSVLSLCDGKLPLFDDENDGDHQDESGSYHADHIAELSDRKIAGGIAGEIECVWDHSDADSESKEEERQGWPRDLVGSAGSEKAIGRRRRNMMKRETLLEKAWEMKCIAMTMMGCADGVDDENNDDDDEGDVDDGDDGLSASRSMPTTPKIGSCMLMDMDEMKACKDLGFAVVRRTHSCSSMEGSSATSSPITSWRISSPGDDPGDVKARLRVWAQVVAAASTARICDRSSPPNTLVYL